MDSALEWLRFAEGDLRAAETLTDAGHSPELICYLCQQSAEKAYKAYLAWLGDDRIPFTHDIEKLRQRSLQQNGDELPEGPAELTAYEASGLYPFLSPIGEEEVQAALDLAQDALAFVRGLIGLDQ